MTVAAFERYALVPLGDLDQVAVVDLQQGTLVQRIPLPPGAGAAGAIMLDDVIGYVANSRRNTISQINALTEHIAEIPVGVSPQGFAFARGRLFVLNGNLDSTGEPVGASWLTVINPATNTLAPGIDSVPLTGPGYAAFATVGGDGLIYIVNRGRSTTAEGRLSVVDPLERKEVASFAGLGLQPGQVATDGGARVFVSSQTEGLLEFNTDSNAVVRGEGEGVPIPTNSGVAVDSDGLVYAIEAGACDPGRPGLRARAGPGSGVGPGDPAGPLLRGCTSGADRGGGGGRALSATPIFPACHRSTRRRSSSPPFATARPRRSCGWPPGRTGCRAPSPKARCGPAAGSGPRFSS